MGGAGRVREGLDVLVRLKDRGYWVNHPRPWDQAGAARYEVISL